jgi:hypothetical protein
MFSEMYNSHILFRRHATFGISQLVWETFVIENPFF